MSTHRKHKALPPVHLLWELFSYDPLRGNLHWRYRTSIRTNLDKAAGNTTKNGYKTVCIGYSKYLQHRVVWAWLNGRDPADMQIDHIDRNRKNNTYWNLRLASNLQNGFNAGRSNNTSGHRGVHWYSARNKWQVYVSVDKRRKHIGYFSDYKDAVNAYQEAINTYLPNCIDYLPQTS